MNTPQPSLTVYTIGHSNQSTEAFLELLRLHAIDVLVDVRSAPYSRYVPHFNQPALAETARAAGLRYLYLGEELGGRPANLSLYDAEGRALYRAVSKTELFRSGIERLKVGAERYRVAIMCSEENPDECHRSRLVGRVLLDEGARVVHIRGDGRLEDQQPPATREAPRQQSLFGDDADSAEVEDEWKSVRSVLPKRLRDSSSTS